MSEYQADAEWELQRWEYNYSLLPPQHRALLPGLPAKFAAARQCVQVNQYFIKTMLMVFDEDLGAPPHLAGASAAAAEYSATTNGRVSPQDVDKVRSVAARRGKGLLGHDLPEGCSRLCKASEDLRKESAERSSLHKLFDGPFEPPGIISYPNK